MPRGKAALRRWSSRTTVWSNDATPMPGQRCTWSRRISSHFERLTSRTIVPRPAKRAMVSSWSTTRPRSPRSPAESVSHSSSPTSSSWYSTAVRSERRRRSVSKPSAPAASAASNEATVFSRSLYGLPRCPRMRNLLMRFAWIFLLAACASAPHEQYLDRYFHTFPTRATAAGRHDLDRELERLDAADRASWLTFNQQTRAALAGRTDLDSELLRRAIDREIFALTTLHTPERNPLYWTGIVSSSVVFLLVRDNRAEEARARARQIPRLLRTAEATLTADAAQELCAVAAGQARPRAQRFRRGLQMPGAPAALAHFATFLDDLKTRATGSPRLGANYAEVLRLATGERDPDALLARAERDLAAKRKEAEAFVQSVWPGTTLRQAFAKAEADHHEGAGGGRREDTTCAPSSAPCPLTDNDWAAFATKLVDERSEERSVGKE